MEERPCLLVVEPAPGDLRSPSRLLQSRFHVVTCPVESVALEFVSERRPVAALLDASAVYLEGASLVERWKQASPSTRLFFVDADGPWVLLMEFAESESGQVTINPCALDEIASALDGMLGGAGGKESEDGRLALLAV